MKPLIARYPEFYTNSEEFVDLQQALEPEVLAIWDRCNGVLDQLSVGTATWGLKYWEQGLGLAIDETASAEDRRSKIRSILRGAGTTTIAMIKNLAASYSKGEVEVLEYPELFRIEIKFVNTVGTPENIDDLTAQLRASLPAHLEWDYIITYIMWTELNATTWDGLSAQTWDEVKELI